MNTVGGVLNVLIMMVCSSSFALICVSQHSTLIRNFTISPEVKREEARGKFLC